MDQIFRFQSAEAASSRVDAAPIQHRLMAVLCVTLFAVLVALFTIRVDVYATAMARVEPIGRSKVIQPLDAGLVRAVNVSNGDHVHAGDVLLELDSTLVKADRDNSAAQLDALEAEIVRRRAAIVAGRTADTEASASLALNLTLNGVAWDRAAEVYTADMAHLKADLAMLDAKIAEDVVLRKGLEQTIAEQTKLSGRLGELAGMWRAVLDKGLASKANVINAEQAYDKELTTLANLKGQMMTAQATVDELRSEKANVISQFVDDNTAALVTALSMRDEVAQSVVKAEARLSHMRLVAPINGTIQELSVTTIGQVVTAGQPLLTIVPENARLEIEALVMNGDIGFVAVGQRAIIKIEAFPYVFYGSLSGTVTRIARDAVSSRETFLSASDSVNPSDPRRASISTVPQMEGMVYPVTISLDKSSMLIDGNYALLSPGMRATAEVRTGRRRVIEYLLSPIRKVVSETAHER
jgi:hemolysin D